MAPPRLLGLRVDVDTHDGMRDGVPRLLEALREAGVAATFYLAMGPDRSGLAVLNALKPGFLAKMRRTGAARVYGWRTILSGTLLPARPVAIAFPELARRIAEEGHETGVHAWDHRAWQDSLLRRPAAWAAAELDRGAAAYRRTVGEPPRTFAAPAWLTRDEALLHQETLGLAFASDCRGREPFLPSVHGHVLRVPQVPTTLPTLDEALGDTHSEASAFFADVVAAAKGTAWPMLTIHAELEGGPHDASFRRFLDLARSEGVSCVTLGELLDARLGAGPLTAIALRHAPVPGRHGVVSQQG